MSTNAVKPVVTIRSTNTSGTTHKTTVPMKPISSTPLNNVTNSINNTATINAVTNKNNVNMLNSSKPINMLPVTSSKTDPLELNIFSPVNTNKQLSRTSVIATTSTVTNTTHTTTSNVTNNTVTNTALDVPNSIQQSHMRTGSMTAAVISPVRDPVTTQPTTTTTTQQPILNTLPVSSAAVLSTRSISTPAPLNRPVTAAVAPTAPIPISLSNDNIASLNKPTTNVIAKTTTTNVTPVIANIRSSVSADNINTILNKPAALPITQSSTVVTATLTATAAPTQQTAVTAAINHTPYKSQYVSKPHTTIQNTPAHTTTQSTHTLALPAAPSTVTPDHDRSLIQLQVVKSLINDNIASLQTTVRSDINNLHLELIHQFHIHEQQTDRVLNNFITQFQSLVDEVKQLRVENNEFRQMYGMR